MFRKTVSTLLLLVIACLCQLTNANAQTVTPLQQGEPIERTLSHGETHTYSVRLEQDQFLQLVVDQRGVDVVVRANGPDGKLLGQFDTPNGANGPEAVSILARDSGLYQFEVAPLGQVQTETSGRYEIRIIDLRPATKEELAAANGREIAKTKGSALLDETTATIQQIRSPETRVRAQLQAAQLLWKIDEKRARKLIDEATIGFNEYSTRISPDDSDYYQRSMEMMRFRIQSIQMLAAADPEMALSFLIATRDQNNLSALMGNGPANQEHTLELWLAGQIAAKNPKRAVEIAEEDLRKGYSDNFIQMISQMQASAPESAARLTDELLTKLQGENLLKNQAAANAAANLLRFGRLSAAGNNPTQVGVLRSPLLSDSQYRDLLNKMLSAVLSYTPSAQKGYSPEQNSMETMAATLSSMKSDVDKVAPGKMAAIEKLTNASDSDTGDEDDDEDRMAAQYRDKIDKGSVSQALETVGQMPDDMKERYYNQVATKAAMSGDIGLAQQIVTDHTSNPYQRQMMIKMIDQQAFMSALSKGNLSAAMDIASRVRAPKERAMLLAQLVQSMGPSQKRETMLGILEQVRGLIGGSGRAEDQQEMNVLMMVAQAYLTLEPKRSFDVIEPIIDQLNEMAMAAASLNGFGQKYLQDGELLMENGNSVGTVANQLITMIGALAAIDFDRAKGLADRIQRPEVRLTAYLEIAGQTMSPQPRGVRLRGIMPMMINSNRQTID